MKENESKTYQTLWDATKAVLTGEFIAINVFTEKQKKDVKSIINLPSQELENEKVKCKAKK